MNIRLNWILAYLVMFIGLLSLGVWQIHRADEKQAYLDLQAQRRDQSVDLMVSDISEDIKALRYKKTTITGSYDTTKQFLLDNQIEAGKVGYFVFTPFKLTGTNKAILVNRGWVPLIEPRTTLPNVAFAPSPANVSITGSLNAFPSVGIRLKGATQATQTEPSVVEVLDDRVLSSTLGYDLLAFQVELNPEEPNGYVRNWHITTLIPPEKHLAYALQWFGLALVLTILFIKMALKK